jgi:NAD(P)-dependent dehydrogenase (short-subunit alcohol dehydrogenase family)
VDLHLRDHVAIVTGGSSGIGLEVVRTLAEEGVCVATCARDEARLKEALAPLMREHGDRLLSQSCDVLDAPAVEQLVETAFQRFGRVDGVVCNAGRSRMSTFATTTDDEWREELDLKFWSVLNPVRAARAALRDSDNASIVIMNAILARQPEPQLVATAAARAGLLNLARSLATELAPDAIRVNTVSLGLIATGQWRRRFEQSGTQATWEQWSGELASERGVPFGRLGTPSEVAPTVAFLLSDRSSYTTGATVDIGGGVARYV